jgi:dolichyl-phosphate beta-glucosyltransferase
MSEQDFYLTIVIPAYKEESRIHIILEAIARYEKTKDFEIETIVVVDASPDNTAGAAKAYIGKLKHLKVHEGKENKGKGGAVRDGIMLARGKYVVFADADNSTPIEQVDKLLPYAKKYEVVIGSRYNDGGKLAIPQPLFRRVGTRVLNMIIQAIAISGIRDTQCGFKLFETEAAKKIFAKQSIYDFSFDIEILVIAKKLGYKIRETGITWYDNPHSTVSPIKDGLKMIADCITISHNAKAGNYNP